METWRKVVGVPGYEVSNLGNVRSVDREVVCSNGVTKFYRGRKRAIIPDRRGYTQVMLSVATGSGQRVKACWVHRLVLEAFRGPPEDGQECCHNNGIPNDNRIENLRWDSRSGNFSDKKSHGTHNGGEAHPLSKLSNAEAEQVYERRKNGERLASLASEFGISESTVSLIASGKLRPNIKRAKQRKAA